MRKLVMIAFIGLMTAGAFVAASLAQDTKVGSSTPWKYSTLPKRVRGNWNS